jgi:UDP-3-O-[3-hydroxymyristoyl] glucosamine N-acyltransferase
VDYVGAGSGVTCDVPAGKTVLGYPAVEARDALKQWAILKRLVNDSKINRCILSYS